MSRNDGAPANRWAGVRDAKIGGCGSRQRDKRSFTGGAGARDDASEDPSRFLTCVGHLTSINIDISEFALASDGRLRSGPIPETHDPARAYLALRS